MADSLKLGCNIDRSKRQESGFTLVEILIVVAIFALLVAVVVPSVEGMMGRGSDRGYDLDERSLQQAVAAFYSDRHVYDPVNGWNEVGSTATPDFKFPTRSGSFSELYPGDAVEISGQAVKRLMEASDDSAAEPEDVVEAAIWMGLLVNEPGTGTNPASKDNSAPLATEEGLYIQEVPESCSAVYNSSKGKGTYTWIVGNYGRVYGVFQDGASWYIGFSGSYP